MKTLLLCAVLFLSGCSIITLPTYNESEYAQLIDIATLASESHCKLEETIQLEKLSNRLVFYSAYLPHNEKIAEGTVEMNKTIHTLQPLAPDSTLCHMKLRIITSMATTLADAAGGKPR
jgi:hypothetical protein